MTTTHRPTVTGFAFALALALTACDEGGEGDQRTRDGRVSPSLNADASDASAHRCERDEDCDDGLGCTVGACVSAEGGERHCTWTVAPGACLIHHVCVDAGEARDGDACATCEPDAAVDAWTLRDDGAGCDDGDACTRATQCAGGRCVGEPVTCEPAGDCEEVTCDPDVGCATRALSGARCDDDDPCTDDDVCVEGACAGQPRDCDDDDPCTVGQCDPDGACAQLALDDAPCDDGDPCTTEGMCEDGLCLPGAERDCDDGNPCTIDLCDPLAGCTHLPTQSPCCQGLTSVCDDGDPCTDDLCDPATASCTHVPNTGPCDDGDACTTGDVCGDDGCAGTPRICDDGDRCTRVSCDPDVGCVDEPLSDTPCDDGLACTTDDTCADGVCIGDDSACLCTPDLDGWIAAKLTALSLGTSGQPGEGLDVDEDASTCAPEDDCAGGVDNMLSVFAFLANEPLADAVADGDVVLLVTLDGAAPGARTLAVVEARLAPGDAGCDLQADTCAFEGARDFFDPDTCAPIAAIPSTLSGGRVTGGGPDTALPFQIPVGDGVTLDVTIAHLRVDAQVTVADGAITHIEGLLAGAIRKQTLLDALGEVPDGVLPIDRDAAIGLVDALITNDIDTDGDGAPDAASVGIKLVGHAAELVGLD